MVDWVGLEVRLAVGESVVGKLLAVGEGDGVGMRCEKRCGRRACRLRGACCDAMVEGPEWGISWLSGR